jgi:toluene monooxygenase system ferredoxin subunit
MSSWIPAGTLDDLWEGEMRAVIVDTVDVLLVNLGGTVFAYENCCPHLATPLSNGRLDDHVLTCAAHEWCFDLRDGSGVNPDTARLRRLAVRCEGDAILVDLHAAARR